MFFHAALKCKQIGVHVLPCMSSLVVVEVEGDGNPTQLMELEQISDCRQAR